jgi:hypothetical protein
MNKETKGQGKDAFILDHVAFDNTTPIVSPGDDMRRYDSVGIQLVSDFTTQSFTASGSDHVVDSTKTWTLSEFTFTGLAGATITIEGSAASDGTFTIQSVTSAHVIVTTVGPGADETFSSAVTVTVTQIQDPPAGDWKIEVSNDFVPVTNGTAYGQPSNDGTWTDITSAFSPSIAAVTTAGTQYAQADLTARTLRYTFTPSGGQGTVSVIRYCKSWS